MKRVIGVTLLGLVALAGSLSANAQSCGFINDEAGILTNPSVIQTGARGLINQGADVHVVTVANIAKYGTRLADVEKAYERACPKWVDKHGKANANLFVIMLYPTTHAKNVFYGDSYLSALPTKGVIDSIYSKAANPSFAHGQFDNGFAVALADFSKRVSADHDQAQHPVQQTTIVNKAPEQPTNFKPFYVFLLLLVIGGGIWLAIYLLRKRKDGEEGITEAQQEASSAQQRATNLFRTADTNSPSYADVAAQYNDLSGSVTYDPNSSFPTAAAYITIARAWNNLADDIKGLRTPKSSYSAPTPVDDAPPAPSPAGNSYGGYPTHTPHYNTPVTPPYTPPAPQQPTVIHETTYVDRGSSNDGLLTGVLLGEALSDHGRDRDYDRPSYREPERETPSYSEPRETNSGDDSSYEASSDNDSNDNSDTNSGDDSSY